MDWHSLAMKSTELRWTGPRLGDAAASWERMEDRMLWMQARQPSRRASSTAGESLKRLKEDTDMLALEPEEVVATIVGSYTARERIKDRISHC